MRRLMPFMTAVVLWAGVGASAGADAPGYTLTELGTLRGVAYAINDRGQVVGVSQIRRDTDVQHAFLWENGKMTDLGTLGGTHSAAYGINERGQIVGQSSVAGTNVQHAFVWENGKMTDLGTPGRDSGASGINERGQVVGYSVPGGAFLWDSGKMTDLGALDGPTRALAINERAQIVGFSVQVGSNYVGDRSNRSPFVWENGVLAGLGTPGWATAINERGQIVGTSTYEPWQAFVWENGKLTKLLAPSKGLGISESGQVFAASLGFDGNADRVFRWENGVTTDLGALVGNPTAMNERGQIVGESGGRAVLWSPGRELLVTAPLLYERRPGGEKPLRATRSGGVATVGTRVAVDDKATVTLVVRNPRTGKTLTLQPGSKLATTTLHRRAPAARATLAGARTFTVKALLPTVQLRRGAAYQLVFTARGTGGKSSKLTIRFFG